MAQILIALTDFVINIVSSLGYFGIFLSMTIESASIPLPSEIIMGIAGFLVYKGEMNLLIAALVGALGNITGSTIMYFLGSKGGRPVIRRYGKYIHFDEQKFDKVDKWFEKWGDKVVFVSQLLPVVRTFVSLPAGILKTNFPKFILYTFTGAFIWCFVLAWGSSLLGPEWLKISEYIHDFEIVISILFVVALAYIILKRLYRFRQKTVQTN